MQSNELEASSRTTFLDEKQEWIKFQNSGILNEDCEEILESLHIVSIHTKMTIKIKIKNNDK